MPARIAAPLLSALLLLGAGSVARAQDDPDEQAIVMAWYKLTGVTPDLRGIAEQSQAVRGATAFDRPDVLAAEEGRLRALFAAADPGREFTLQVSDRIGEYDHAAGRFTIGLFTAGTFVPLRAWGMEYQLVFANADPARAIPMPKEAARSFDEQLRSRYRQVTNEVRFRVIGSGDPSGAVGGERVVRAELLAARLLGADGEVVFTPTITPVQALAAAQPPALDIARTDAAGFRVGGKGGDLEQTLARLMGEPSRTKPGKPPYPGVATVMTVNQMGCDSYIGRRGTGEPGNVCVTAFLDEDDVVRMVKVERVFHWIDADVFRRALVGKYGPVAQARGATWGWGPDIPHQGPNGEAFTVSALTASWSPIDDFERRSGNAIPRIRLTMQLYDAAWTSQR